MRRVLSTGIAVLAVGLCAPSASAAVLERPVSAHRVTAAAAAEPDREITTLDGWAENAVRLPNGKLAISTQSVVEVDPVTGAATALTPDYGVLVGGMVVQGNTLYYLVGNGGDAPTKKTGKLMALDLTTHQTRDVLTGFNQVNGLVGLADGSLAFTVILGSGGGVWKTNPQKTSATRISTTPLTPDGITRIGDDLFVSAIVQGEVWKVNATSGATKRLANFIPIPDDLDAMPDGYLYQATEAGLIWKIDPVTGKKSVHTSGILGATSAKKWDADTLVVTTLQGGVRFVAL
ncbi:hypothetical protein ACMYYO_00030 [Dermacoccaceae bacterium W4C1]